MTDMARLLWHLGGEVGHGYDMATASRLPFGVSKVFKSVSKCAKIRWLLRNLCCSRPGLPRKHLKNSKSSKFLRFKMPCTLKTCWFVTWFHYYYYYLIMRKSNSLARRCQLQFGWAMRAWCVMSQWGATWKKKSWLLCFKSIVSEPTEAAEKNSCKLLCHLWATCTSDYHVCWPLIVFCLQSGVKLTQLSTRSLAIKTDLLWWHCPHSSPCTKGNHGQLATHVEICWNN